MGPMRQNPIQRTVRTAHLSVIMTVHNFQYTIQHRTVLIISHLTTRQCRRMHGLRFVLVVTFTERLA